MPIVHLPVPVVALNSADSLTLMKTVSSIWRAMGRENPPIGDAAPVAMRDRL